MKRFLRNFVDRRSYVFYLQFWPDRIRLTDNKRGQPYDQRPHIALRMEGKKERIVEIGDAAESWIGRADVRVLKPLMELSDLPNWQDYAEEIFKHVIRTVAHGRHFANPVVILHDMEMYAMRDYKDAFGAITFNSGAREVIVVQGPELVDLDLVRLRNGQKV